MSASALATLLLILVQHASGAVDPAITTQGLPKQLPKRLLKGLFPIGLPKGLPKGFTGLPKGLPNLPKPILPKGLPNLPTGLPRGFPTGLPTGLPKGLPTGLPKPNLPNITILGPIITTFAGNGSEGGFAGDGGPATAALLATPTSVAVGTDGSVYIADRGVDRIRVVNPAGIITSLTKNFTTTAIAVGPDGSVYVSDSFGCVVRRITRTGKVIVAGNGNCSYSGDGGPAKSAGLATPAGLAVGPDGSLYIACPGMTDARVRRVSPSGIITTFAGTGPHTYETGRNGDGGKANNASLNWPYGVAVGPDGSVYISDGNVIRRVLTSGVIVTHAGNGTSGYSGDGGPALSATLGSVTNGLAVGPDGTVYIADTNNNRVRVVSPDSIISTYAGNGVPNFSGDGGVPTAAAIALPVGVALGADGSLYIGGSYNAVRRVRPGLKKAPAIQRLPTGLPTGLPKGLPTGLPKGLPTGLPKGLPTGLPKGLPTGLPKGL